MTYLIIVYDIDESRVNKVNKYLKRYLHWRQNSVFEGELNQSQYVIMLDGLKEIADESVDSIIIYVCKSDKHLNKVVIGIEKNTTDMII